MGRSVLVAFVLAAVIGSVAEAGRPLASPGQGKKWNSTLCSAEFEKWVEQLEKEFTSLMSALSGPLVAGSMTPELTKQHLDALDAFAARIAANPLGGAMPEIDPAIERKMIIDEHNRADANATEDGSSRHAPNPVTISSPAEIAKSLADGMRKSFTNPAYGAAAAIWESQAAGEWAMRQFEWLRDYCAAVGAARPIEIPAEPDPSSILRRVGIIGGAAAGVGIAVTTLGGSGDSGNPSSNPNANPNTNPNPTPSPNPNPALNPTAVNAAYQGTAERVASTCGNALPSAFGVTATITGVNQAGTGGTLSQQGPFSVMTFPITSVVSAAQNTFDIATSTVTANASTTGAFQVQFRNLKKLLDQAAIEGQQFWTRISGGSVCEDAYNIKLSLR